MSYCVNHHACVEDALAQAERICAAQNLRFTDLRRRVLALIWESHRPVKAYDLLASLERTDSSAKPPTVYRALDFLRRHGLVHRLSGLNAYIGCDHPGRCEACYFLICESCGEISECCDESVTGVIVSVVSKRYFTVSGIALEIFGTCKTCQTA